MTKIVTTDFGSIHDALNRLIIGEVKAALRLLPGKRIESDGTGSLCHIVVSPNGDYNPLDIAVRMVRLDEKDNLHVYGYIDGNTSRDISEMDEDYTDWLDITDFHYLIEQMKDMMPDGGHDLTSEENMWGVVNAAHKTFEYC